jgi:uncharacterized protein YoaH (UPF0181 family)
MPPTRKQGSAGKSPHRGAGIAGASSGTVLALVANNLPANSPWKPWLILIAPSIAVAIGVFVGWANGLLEDYLNSQRKKLLFSRIKNTIQAALSNPTTSSMHKEQLQRQLERIEKLQFDSDLDLLIKE